MMTTNRSPRSSMAAGRIILFLLCSHFSCTGAQQEWEHKGSLYKGNSVRELLSLCKDLREEDLVTVPEKKQRQCPVNETCIKRCNEDRLTRLRDAQTRVSGMLESLDSLERILWNAFVIFVVSLQAIYLIYVGHFKWRTLPLIGYEFEFEDDPTYGYRCSHFMWMQWVVFDSNHPRYYLGMTPDVHEIEYIPQYQEWVDPEEADSDEGLHPAWSYRDICDLTTDPHERLEFYFRRIQLKYQVDNKITPNIRKFKQMTQQ